MKIYAKTREQQVYEHLLNEITSGAKQSNTRLAGVRSLAKLYGVSAFTVQKALKRLEQQGLIEQRQGSGSYVKEIYQPQTTADNALLYMHAYGDIFSETVGGLCRVLQQQGKLPIVIDSRETGADELFRRVAFSDIRFLVVNANNRFPFELLAMDALKEKTIIGIYQWESDIVPKNCYRVLCDWEFGCREAAAHFWAAGHRRVVIVESTGHSEVLKSQTATEEEKIKNCGKGYFFMKAWQEYGGECVVTETRGAAQSNHLVEPDVMKSALTARKPATAVYGTRDLEAWSSSKFISAELPELLADIEFIGWGNTPWSYLSSSPISTIDWNTQELVEIVGGIIQAESNGEPADAGNRISQVKPKLLIKKD